MKESQDNPLCPFCNTEVNVEDIETKIIVGRKDTTKGGLFEKLATYTTKIITVVYICPHCRKILGFSN